MLMKPETNYLKQKPGYKSERGIKSVLPMDWML